MAWVLTLLLLEGDDQSSHSGENRCMHQVDSVVVTPRRLSMMFVSEKAGYISGAPACLPVCLLVAYGIRNGAQKCPEASLYVPVHDPLQQAAAVRLQHYPQPAARQLTVCRRRAHLCMSVHCLSHDQDPALLSSKVRNTGDYARCLPS